jgi:Domain of unknown function (DUF4304)
MIFQFSKVIDAFSKNLENYGFSRDKTVFIKNSGAYVFLVNFQKSKDSTKELLKFTINVGVSYTKLLKIKNCKPDILDAHYRVRLINLIAEYKKEWWYVTNENDLNLLIFELNSLIENYLKPFFDSFVDEETLINIWKSDKCPGLTDFQRLEYLNLLS